MSSCRAIAALGALLAALPSYGLLSTDCCSNLFLSVSADVRSAYVSSSGGVVESRPVTSQSVDGSCRLGKYGRIDGYVWVVSALTGQKDEYRRRAFNEIETGIQYGYDWRLADKLALSQSLGHIWDPSIGYEGYDSSSMTQEVNFQQALHNAYVTPYYDVMGCYNPTQWVRVNTGLLRNFAFFGGSLTVSPFAFVVWGSGSRYEAKFGSAPDMDFIGFTPMYSMVGVRAKYRLNKRFSLYVRLQQWDIIDKTGREYQDMRNVEWAVCDLPFVVLGVTMEI